MNQAEFIKRVKHQATGIFAQYNCEVSVERAASNAFEVRVAPRAFSYYAVFIIDENKMSSDDLHNVFSKLDGIREQMIDNVFQYGFAPKPGYPKVSF